MFEIYLANYYTMIYQGQMPENLGKNLFLPLHRGNCKQLESESSNQIICIS